jgi:hypothetical protein
MTAYILFLEDGRTIYVQATTSGRAVEWTEHPDLQTGHHFNQTA